MFLYTIIEQEHRELGTTPFIARVLEVGGCQEPDAFDPRPSAPWMQTRSDLVMAVNRQFSGARYVTPEVLQAVIEEEQRARPCHCTLEAPAPECEKGRGLWAAIDRAAENAQFLRDIGSSEGNQITATDAIGAGYDSYAYHVEAQNPGRELLLSTLECVFGVLEGRSDLQEIVAGVRATNGARQKPREEEIYPGYQDRATASTADLARMIAGLTFLASLPLVSPLFGPQAQLPLYRDIVEHAKELACAYRYQHLEPGQENSR